MANPLEETPQASEKFTPDNFRSLVTLNGMASNLDTPLGVDRIQNNPLAVSLIANWIYVDRLAVSGASDSEAGKPAVSHLAWKEAIFRHEVSTMRKASHVPHYGTYRR